MQINLTDEQLREMVVEALFQKLDEKQRTEMITAALKGLMEPERDTYGYRKSSRLQNATENALLDVARKVIAEELGKTDVVETIRGLVLEGMAKVFSDREKMVNRVASALSDALARSHE